MVFGTSQMPLDVIGRLRLKKNLNQDKKLSYNLNFKRINPNCMITRGLDHCIKMDLEEWSAELLKRLLGQIHRALRKIPRPMERR